MICEDVTAILRARAAPKVAGDNCVVVTDCYYPSFDRVRVFVSRYGAGYRVTDGGELARVVFSNGRGDGALASGLEAARLRHDLTVIGDCLAADADSADWLPAAVLAVANGAALAANEAMGIISHSSDNSLLDAIYEAICKVVPRDRIKKSYKVRGESGKEWTVGLAITGINRPLLINSVKPHANSISSAYTAFSDIGTRSDMLKWSVYRDALAQTDVALMSKVSTLLPLNSLESSAQQTLMTH